MNRDARELRVNLAYAYRILADLSMDDHTYTHLSIRSEDGNSYYIYPFGIRFEETTPDNIVKVDFDGKIIEGSDHYYNLTGYVIHSAIYKKRSDINCIFHLHTTDSVAVSSQKRGLMPISQWALHFYNKVSYCDYDGLSLEHAQGEDVVNALGDNFVMLLNNHGMICSGRKIQEAFFYTYHLERACRVQNLLCNLQRDELIIPSHETCMKAVSDLNDFEKDIGYRDWVAWKRMVDNKYNLHFN